MIRLKHGRRKKVWCFTTALSKPMNEVTHGQLSDQAPSTHGSCSQPHRVGAHSHYHGQWAGALNAPLPGPLLVFFQLAVSLVCGIIMLWFCFVIER